MTTIEIESRGEVEWVTLNRPEQLNALNPEMVRELRTYFRTLEDRPETRVVVLRGSGRAFCAGLDLKSEPDGGGEVTASSISTGLRQQRSIAEIYLAMRRCPQPIISLIHGPACGGGFSLALASDIRIAAQTARMNCAYIRIGLGGCDMGSSYFLPRLVGASLAAELVLTGKFISADRALDVGLVSQVVDEDMLEAAAEEDIQHMLRTSPLGLRLSKEALNINLDAPGLEAAIALEDRNQVLCANSDDFSEGVQAFLEHREPRWRAS
ncbi:enoyl-CoA hydratase/isomerase family protein [Hyphomonas sp.]|uniref:enoyl-CoA hydratase/isomerase family protein n=1 Tax=Hyphomonas sp. TaxID=87 RepID=UPI003F6F4550